MEGFTCEKSGWNLDHIDAYNFVVSTYKPIGVGTYIPLPFPLDKTHGTILNIENARRTSDNDHLKCFLWSVLAHENLCGVIDDGNRNRHRIDKKVDTYKHHPLASSVNVDGIKFPMTKEQLPKFDAQNPEISLTVLASFQFLIRIQESFPSRTLLVSNQTRRKHHTKR